MLLVMSGVALLALGALLVGRFALRRLSWRYRRRAGELLKALDDDVAAIDSAHLAARGLAARAGGLSESSLHSRDRARRACLTRGDHDSFALFRDYEQAILEEWRVPAGGALSLTEAIERRTRSRDAVVARLAR